MAARERTLDRARHQAHRSLVAIGDEFREARFRAGLTQGRIGEAVGISASEVSRIELGQARRVPFHTLAVIAAVLGLDLPLRVFPAGEPIRDAAQLGLLARLRALLKSVLRWRIEVPIRIPGDRRAWDAVIEGPGWRVPVEAETRLRDVQALSRRLALKKRDDRADIVVLLVAGTRHNRHVLRLARADLAEDFPCSGRDALAALANGRPPPSSSIVLL